MPGLFVYRVFFGAIIIFQRGLLTVVLTKEIQTSLFPLAVYTTGFHSGFKLIYYLSELNNYLCRN